MLFFFPRGVLDEILNLIESVSEGFNSYFHCRLPNCHDMNEILLKIASHSSIHTFNNVHVEFEKGSINPLTNVKKLLFSVSLNHLS